MLESVVTTIQQQVKIYDIPVDYQVDIFRLLQQAQAKKSELVVLPALSSLMLVPPLASRTKLEQLRKYEERKAGLARIMDRLFGRGDDEEAGPVDSGITEELLDLIYHHPGEIYDAYIDLFSAAALKYRMTIVAGSFYLREHEDGDCAHVSYVFAPDGQVLGRQEKLHLTPVEQEFCRAGEVLQVIETDVGRIGILIEDDVLYPECGRLLAYHGVEIFINLTATSGPARYNQQRTAFAARVDENGVLGAQSCLCGNNLMQPSAPELVGRSVLLQPFQLSAQGDGILAEGEAGNGEAVVSGVFEIEGLKDYWVRPSPGLRNRMRPEIYRQLSQFYENRRTIDQAYWNPDETDLLSNTGDRASREVTTTPTATLEPTASANPLVSPFADDEGQ